VYWEGGDHARAVISLFQYGWEIPLPHQDLHLRGGLGLCQILARRLHVKAASQSKLLSLHIKYICNSRSYDPSLRKRYTIQTSFTQKKSLTSASLAIVASRIKLAAFGTTNPERGGITGLPILPLSIERLKPPPLPRPVSSHRTIPVVDFLYQLPHRLPAEVKCIRISMTPSKRTSWAPEKRFFL
jgi:hypothetical protein